LDFCGKVPSTMKPRKIPKSHPIEWDIDDLFGFRDFFDDLDDQFARARRHLGRVAEQARKGSLPPPEKGGPYVYGWTFTLDERGPRFEEFGNVPGLVPPKKAARASLKDGVLQVALGPAGKKSRGRKAPAG
jgi:hypothetical protein